MSDFFVGYAAGQGAGANSVDVQGHFNDGFNTGYKEGANDGMKAEHATQSWYVERLMRHLKARNSQKQALLQVLRKYAPNHPYLNETIVPSRSAELKDSIESGENSYAKIANNCNADESSRLLALEMGGGIITEGDLAMEADGVAFVADNSSDEIEKEISQVRADLNASPEIRGARLSELYEVEQARVTKALKEGSDEKYSNIMKPATNFMNKIFG